MKAIGIDEPFGDAYESVGNFWRAILPSPTISDAVLDPTVPVEFRGASTRPNCIFREDDFNPVARTRRGRFYVLAPGPQPSERAVMPFPIGAHILLGHVQTGQMTKMLVVYDQFQLAANTKPLGLVALGSAESLWQVILMPERISTGEFLFTLKARRSFSILPELDHQKIPERGRAKVAETVQKLIDAAHRESPESIVDRARGAAQSCLATWVSTQFSDDRHFTLGSVGFDQNCLQ